MCNLTLKRYKYLYSQKCNFSLIWCKNYYRSNLCELNMMVNENMLHNFVNEKFILHYRLCKLICFIIKAETSMFHIKMNKKVLYISVQKNHWNKVLELWYCYYFDSRTLQPKHLTEYTRVRKMNVPYSILQPKYVY